MPLVPWEYTLTFLYLQRYFSINFEKLGVWKLPIMKSGIWSIISKCHYLEFLGCDHTIAPALVRQHMCVLLGPVGSRV